jgi:hypothetical protein
VDWEKISETIRRGDTVPKDSNIKELASKWLTTTKKDIGGTKFGKESSLPSSLLVLPTLGGTPGPYPILAHTDGALRMATIIMLACAHTFVRCIMYVHDA